MSRPAVISLSLVESIDGYGDALAGAAQDGRIDSGELARLVRLWRPIPRKAGRLHESTQGAIRALSGQGIYGPWFGRMVKESRDVELRIVVRNDDPEPPDGPGGERKAA